MHRAADPVPSAGEPVPPSVERGSVAPAGRRDVAVLVMALLIGVGTRLVQSGFSLDTDEAFSSRVAALPFADAAMAALHDRSHPPLHLLVLHAWMRVFSESEFAARALSVCAFAGFMLVAWRILRRYANGAVLAGAMLLLAVSPLYVYYGQMVRPYAFVMLSSALVFERYLALADAPGDPWRRRTWAGACALAVATQYLGAMMIGACIAAALVRRGRRALPVVGYAAVGASTILPWFVAAMWLSTGGESLGELLRWMGKPSLADFAWFYASAFGVPAWGRLAFLLPVVLVLACLPLAHAARESSASPGEQRRRHDVVLWALAAFVVPLAAFVASVVGSHTIFVARQLLGAQFALLVLVVLGLRLVPPPAARVALVALLAWTMVSTRYAFPAYTRPDWRAVAAVVRDQGVPYVAAERWVEWPLEYYVGAPPLRVGAPRADLGVSEFVLVCRDAGCQDARREASGTHAVRDVGTFVTRARPLVPAQMRVEVLRLSRR